MNLLFIGCIYSDNQKECFLHSGKRGYQYAAQNLQEALVEGFLQNDLDSFNVLSIPSLSTYPKGCKLPVIKDGDFTYNGEKLGRSFGYLNLPFVNHPNRKRVDDYVDHWCESHSGDKTIFVYALLGQQMAIAVRAKQRHPDVKLCIIIPDLPIYMNCNKIYKALGLQKRSIETISRLVHRFDSYVVLAQPMIEALGISDKPALVVEGIYDAIDVNNSESDKLPDKTIMYAGGIQRRYGVFDLIEAFHGLGDEDCRLILCGGGNEMEALNEWLEKDSRISYLGLLPTEKVRELQKQVTLLVNPRHSSEEFTKYSFPSKTLEYMASGTPVLMSPLPSMPDEYKEHLYLFEDETVEGMGKAMADILAKDESELSTKGSAAKSFIMEHKSPKAQVEKIIGLFNS